MKELSLNKCRHILQMAYQWYCKKNLTLSPEEQHTLEQQLITLEGAIDSGNKSSATPLANNLEAFYKQHRKKSFFLQIAEVGVAIVVALVLAIVVRQEWFELYEIPTGSMRPTYREQDRVAVSKTPFGLNIPLTTGHLMFDPSLLRHGEVTTFTTEGIPSLDEDTAFMGVIPYKKRLIKRLIGKPGDSLYFYGGKIYGVNSEGHFLREFLDADWAQNLEYIPFIDFAGRVTSFSNKEMHFHQFNQLIGRLVSQGGRRLEGEIYSGKQWRKDDPSAQSQPHTTLKAYSDFFGMRNFAMARLLTRKEVELLEDPTFKDLPEGVLYLELRHHASLTFPHPFVIKDSPLFALLNPLRSIIPLQQRDLDRIMDNMYTARLVFRDGRATRYNVEGTQFSSNSPSFASIPDGTYEFYHGKLQQIGWGALTTLQPASHPLASHSPENVQKLFNLGIEMNSAFSPHGPVQYYYPSRYAYFREGNLYLLGAPILLKDDPALQVFHEREAQRQKLSSRDKPFTAFKDEGAPLKDGKIDLDFIRTFGITVPMGQYLLLGDNHAMSGDSRVFGFVPEANLQGSPSLLFWPLGERWGVPAQPRSPLLSPPRLIMWSLVAMVLAIWYLWHRRYLHRRIVLKKKVMVTAD